MLTDFPKIECPFARKTYQVNNQDFKKHGNKLKLRTPEVYLVTSQINPGYEWVFQDNDTIAVEKLDGTNIKLKTENGRLVVIQNRKNVIDPLQVLKGNPHIIEGVFRAIQKGYVEDNKEQVGELIGPKLQGNPLKLDNHMWYPFEKAMTSLRYKSFNNHERTFENLSSWFKDHLFSMHYAKRQGFMGRHKGSKDGPILFGKDEEPVFSEGVIFYNLKRRDEGKTYMAKLRRDMFDWYYSDKIEIFK